jgi:hypothetical protein
MCVSFGTASLQSIDNHDSVQIEVAPLRFHIDQDALDFMKRFFSFTRKPTQAASPLPESPTLNNKGFIRKCLVLSGIRITADLIVLHVFTQNTLKYSLSSSRWITNQNA